MYFRCGLLLVSLVLTLTHASALHAPLNARRHETCDEREAYTLLKDSSTGKSFCSSLVYPHGVPTKTHTVTVTTTSKKCTTETRKRVERTTMTDFAFSTVLLPQLTKTEYSSTVLVPSGPTPVVDKRIALPAPAGPQIATPSSLSTCAPEVISCACSSLVPRTTAEKTVTTTKKDKCTTTVFSTKTRDIETTTTFPFTVTPPPVIVSGNGTLTTTVPAACAGSSYPPDGSAFPASATQGFAQYPDQPVTAVECCVACFHTDNCAASSFFADADECGYLITSVRQPSGADAICPLGILDYYFGTPYPPGADVTDDDLIYPGPCGR